MSRAVRAASRRPVPAETFAVVADAQGNLKVDPRYRLAVFDGVRRRAPLPDELVRFPRGSDLFFLPGRAAVPQRAMLEKELSPWRKSRHCRNENGKFCMR